VNATVVVTQACQ